MKKGTILLLSLVVLTITFVVAIKFSLFYVGSPLILLSFLYFISIFSIFEYLVIFIIYIISKLIKKEKIEIRKIIGLILLFIGLLLIPLFLIAIDIDWLNLYLYPTPFYVLIIEDSLEFLLPSTILIVASVLLLKKKK